MQCNLIIKEPFDSIESMSLHRFDGSATNWNIFIARRWHDDVAILAITWQLAISTLPNSILHALT